MSLTNKIKSVVINDLSENPDLLSRITPYSSSNLLRVLVSEGVLSVSDIDSALDAAIHLRALKDYKRLKDGQKNSSMPFYPDHDIEPQFLAYAIKQGNFFTKTELELINFDHGETPETFANAYCPNNLIESLRENLLNPKSLHSVDSNYDPHPVCPCGH